MALISNNDYYNNYYCLKSKGNIGIDNPLGEYYKNIPLAAHPHASHLTQRKTRPQLYFQTI